ncbi:peptide/nickel transport system substrate-binding protein [Methylopila capsulata]|uniref:ABC transporter substrate-binding protein n=1 Tax=Methylopila capsulata TaxID=61654 RepID=A0A9W6IY69_9HYPH|nr:ABC transporter substrate-binding protein [Methylopila capsulata]MBM7853079.1 peptide/nickel transport system substrate-binding protein [Methylopila capsulata]GLK57709.1 ABC transporter substrate-binding protein [Methylopila capsulata]
MTDHKAILAERYLGGLNRRDLMKGLAAGGVVLAAGGLSRPAQAAGNEIKLAWVDHIDTLDPHFTGFLGAVKVHNNIYNGLLKVTYDGQKVAFVPDLAETWDITDGVIHTFKLRPNVKFHDGTPCDAEAVKWNVERVWKGEPKSPHAWKFKSLEKVEVVDPLTVKLTFKQPYAFLPVALTGSTGRAGTIVSPAAVQKFGASFGRNPVGTGPFKFVSWKENDSIVLEKNPDYFEAGLPKLDKVTILIMKEASSAIAAVMSGQVDGMSDSPVQFIPQLKANPNLQVFGEIEGNYVYIAMNCRKAPFDDINLRRAVAFALNREQIIKQAFFGQGIPAYTPISPPMTDFYDPNVAKTGRGQRFDLAKAKEFRAKAKVQDVIEPKFMVTEEGTYGSRLAQTVLPMLAEIGIKPKLELVERAAWVSRRNAGDFEMLDFNWWADLDPDETLFPEFHTGAAWNYPGWSNKRFDECVEQAQVSLDVPTRKALYTEASDIIMDEAPIAITSHMPVFKIFAKKVQGFKYIPVDSLNLHTVTVS